MTCIVGYIEDGSVYLGADSIAVNTYSYDMDLRNDPKVFRNGPMVFGFTDSFRLGQLLRYKLDIPDHDPRVGDFEYLATVFMDAIMDTLKTAQVAEVVNGVLIGGEFILGYKNKLYHVYPDFQVASILNPYTTAGAGADYANGALYVLKDYKHLSAEEKVEQALDAASHHSAAVSGPYTIVKLN